MSDVVLNVDLQFSTSKGTSLVSLKRVSTRSGGDITQRFIEWCGSNGLPLDGAAAIEDAAGRFAQSEQHYLLLA